VRGIIYACAIAAALPGVVAAAASDNGRIAELTLRSRIFNNTRTLRVLLPPGYDDPHKANTRYPVFYFLDGIAAFDAWGVPAAARELWSEHAIPPMLFVGIDNGGSTQETTNPVRDRASEYLPYPDQSWTTPDAPRPRGDSLPSFLFDEVMPLIDARFRTRTDPGTTGLAGDSFAGAAALYVAMKHPTRFGFLLIESPSLHIGEGRLLSEAMKAAAWPRAIYLGVGTKEGDTPAIQSEMLTNMRELQSSIEHQPAVRVHLEVTAGATHGYSAWGQRLPGALRWLLATPPNKPFQRTGPAG
jgi:enterochelin esterase-like enzyme